MATENPAKAAPGAAPPMNEMVAQMIANTLGTTRADVLAKLFDTRRDMNNECGYPEVITEEQLRKMFDRELGRRVVSVYPEETWRTFPSIYEDHDVQVLTPFEESLEAFEKKHHLLHYLQRIDELSGVGHYGLILWGLDDGKQLHEPVDGYDTWEENTSLPRKTKPPERRVIFMRVLDESLAYIATYEQNITNPRYGQPTSYTLTLHDPRNQESKAVATPPNFSQVSVHWSRVSHIADNRKTSEVLGTPRMEPVWNRLYDLTKVLGGSGEMFWRGGFPGVALETQPGMEQVELDVEKTRLMMFDYMNGLQRYLALTGMTAKSLAPQIADPTASFEVQIKAICVTLGIPYRVFMGIEEGVVSGDQATTAWDNRLRNRQERYVTPMVIHPVLQRLVDYGALKPTKEPQGWTIEWPDAAAPSDLDQAEVAVKRTEAFSKYVAGGVDTLVPPLEYLTIICGLEDEVAQQILEAAVTHIKAGNAQEGDDEIPPVMPGDALGGKMTGETPASFAKPPEPGGGLTENYDPTQARDKAGKWSSGGGAGMSPFPTGRAVAEVVEL